MRPSTGAIKLIVLTSIWLGLVSPLPSPEKGKDVDPDVITRDVAIIGGGASGTYAAVRLKQLGQSVVLVEQEDHLGGHTNTYDDNGTPIDYGVWVYSNTTEARNFFAYLNIPTTVQNLSRDPNRAQRYDFRSGEFVAPPSGNVTEAMMRYVLLLLQHPYLENGWDLPDPVPEDLLLSFRDFIEKYDLAAAAETLRLYVQGLGEILNCPTVYIMKYFNFNVVQGIQSGFLRPASLDNSEAYRAATANLGDDLLLSSTILQMNRSNPDNDDNDDNKASVTPDSRQTILVRTPSGLKTIQASKIFITVPPILSNLNAFDLDARESQIFAKFRATTYTTSILQMTGLPRTVQFLNSGIDTPYNIPPIPGTYIFLPTTNPSLRIAYLGGDGDGNNNNKTGEGGEGEEGEETLPFDTVKRIMTENALSLRSAGYDVSVPEIRAYANHYPFGLRVSATEIAGGFYRDLYALQGYRDTYYSGAAFHAHDSGALWRFTERVIGEYGLAR